MVSCYYTLSCDSQTGACLCFSSLLTILIVPTYTLEIKKIIMNSDFNYYCLIITVSFTYSLLLPLRLQHIFLLSSLFELLYYSLSPTLYLLKTKNYHSTVNFSAKVFVKTIYMSGYCFPKKQQHFTKQFTIIVHVKCFMYFSSTS